MRQLIRTDGTKQEVEASRSTRTFAKLIGADTLDTVTLRHLGHPRQVMLVDDNGIAKGLPVNPEATHLYRLNCRPDCQDGEIHGDVVIVHDEDFA